MHTTTLLRGGLMTEALRSRRSLMTFMTRFALFCLTALFLALPAPTPVYAQETALTITVKREADNAPIGDAAVCVTAGANGATHRTDGQGAVVLPNPPAGVILTVFVTKSGFRSSRTDLTLTGRNQALAMILAEGSGGPTSSGLNCAGPVQRMIQAAPRITSFRIGSDSRGMTTDPRVTLHVTVDGPAAFYRVSESREFTGAEWKPFPSGGQIPHRLDVRGNDVVEPAYGTHSLFLQVKPGEANASISAIAAAGVILQPAALKEFRLIGAQLRAFVETARQRGYDFTYVPPRPSSVCPSTLFLIFTEQDLRTQRKKTAVEERIAARFEVFDGPDLLAFWRIKAVGAAHPGFPRTPPSASGGPFASAVTTPQVEVSIITENPQPGRPQAAKRSIRYTRTVYAEEKQIVARSCAELGEPELTSLVLEGPADKLPIQSLGRR